MQSVAEAHLEGAPFLGSSVYTHYLPFLDRTVHVVTGIQEGAVEPVQVCLDENLTILPDCGKDLLLAERDARYELFRSLDPDLWQLCMGLDDVTPIPVGIWLSGWCSSKRCDGRAVLRRTFDTCARNATMRSTDEVGCGTPCSAGQATVTSKVFNGLVVGGSNDCATAARTDDKIFCRARDLNPADGRELPNLVAPAQDIESDGLGARSGTSLAAPLVSGAAVQLLEYNPELKEWPELLRALLMTGASENVDGPVLSLGDTIDDRDGAGLLSVLRSLHISSTWDKVDGGNTPANDGHDRGYMSTYSTPAPGYYAEVYQAKTGFSNRRLRVVLTWDATSTCTDSTLSTASCPAAPVLDANLDLLVRRQSDGVWVGWSFSAVDSYEFVEIPVEANEVYQIYIWASSWAANSTYFAIAWDTYLYGTAP